MLAAAVATIGAFIPTIAISSSRAHAQTTTGTGTGISYTLEGCRGSTSSGDYALGPTSSYFPYGKSAATFVCSSTSDYTTGNLGKGWNELDLVPGRVIVSAGNSADSSNTFQFAVAVDNCSGSDGSSGCTGSSDHPGYDQLSMLTLNQTLDTAKTNVAACGTISIAGGPGYAPPDFSAVGGTGTSLYEVLKITGQAQNTTCDYDFDARLALGSHLYPGSSLHYDLANSSLTTSGIGAKDVSIPVKEIQAPSFSKSQQSTEGTSNVWTVSKTVDNSNLSFANTCSLTTSNDQQTLQVQVTWHKIVTTGGITVVASIDVGNNAHRPIGVSVSDQLYDGTDQTSPDGSAKVQTASLGAGGSTNLIDTWAPPAVVATAYNDIATGTFTDPLFGGASLGSLTASASSTVTPLAADSGNTAQIQDIETLTEGTEVTPDDYQFSVDSISGTAGSFENGYTLGTKTTSVTWDSGTVSDSGSVTFNKTVYVLRATQDSAKLADTATISPDGQDSSQAGASTTINSAAQVSIVISKSMTLAFSSDKTFTFNATGSDGSTGSTTVTIPAGQNGPNTGTISGLAPSPTTYEVDELATAPYGPQTFTGLSVTLPHCSISQSVTNQAPPVLARVKKLTDPSGVGTWTFTLSQGSTPIEQLTNVVANAAPGSGTAPDSDGYYDFSSDLQTDGATYTITETEQPNWDLTSVTGDLSGSSVSTSLASKSCSFTLDLTADSGDIFECSFTNTERSDVTVVKTQNGAAPTDGYSFELKNGSGTPSFDQTLTTTSTNAGTLDFGYLVPGSYTLCELAVPAGTHSTLQDAPYYGTLDSVTGNVCYSFTLGAGSDQVFNIDNSYPQGNALTIGYWKHWNSYVLGSTGWDCSSGYKKTGNLLMDCFLPQSLGGYVVSTAQQGWNVLSNPAGKYAENQLAAQLLASELNVAAGAGTCLLETNAISEANTLLTQIGYSGPPSSKVNSNGQYKSIYNSFVTTASTLNAYNNNQLC